MDVKNIYIIDDDPFFSRGFMKKLENVGDTRLQVFVSVEAALLRIEKEKPEVIFLDHLLGGMNGVDSLPILKQKVPNSDIVMVSNVKDVSVLKRALDEGAAKYFTKDSLLMNNTNGFLQEVMDRDSSYSSFWSSFFKSYTGIPKMK